VARGGFVKLGEGLGGVGVGGFRKGPGELLAGISKPL
jgi:hypothetical protein